MTGQEKKLKWHTEKRYSDKFTPSPSQAIFPFIIMTLRQKQSKFVVMVSLLIQYAYTLDYELTFGDAWARDGHKEDSFHYERLAIDLNLFKDGKYLRDTTDHKPLGEFWESIGGTWGGRWDDGNHYSYGEK